MATGERRVILIEKYIRRTFLKFILTNTSVQDYMSSVCIRYAFLPSKKKRKKKVNAEAKLGEYNCSIHSYLVLLRIVNEKNTR